MRATDVPHFYSFYSFPSRRFFRTAFLLVLAGMLVPFVVGAVERDGFGLRARQGAETARELRHNPPEVLPGGTDRASSAGRSDAATPPIEAAGPHTYLIPASAHASGLGGTSWVSDVVLYNANAGAVQANLYYLEGNHDHRSLTGKQVAVPAGAAVRIGDVVGNTFGQSSSSGALYLGSGEPLLITSRTYNDAASGTYGQFIAGAALAESLEANETARLIQLTRNGDYRTNIGFANASETRIVVQVELFRSDGTALATRSYTIEPYGFYQKTDIIGTDVSDAYALISSSTPGAQFFTYASVIDNRTGDPVFVTPGAGTASAGEALYIPGSAHVNGAGGTQWRTDLEIHNPGDTAATYEVELLKRDQSNPSPQTKSFSLSAGRSVRYTDALEALFDFTGAAALRITPSEGTIVVTSRTYNQTANGTYGQFIPAVSESDVIGAGEAVPLIQLADSASTASGYRTNIGLLNTSAEAISIEAELHDGSGVKLGSRTISLEASEYQQVDRIFRSVTSSTLDNCFAVLSTATTGGSFLAYGSVVDNRSGDPVYVPAAGKGGGGGGEEITITLPGGVGMELVHIPAGIFTMGSPASEPGRSPNEDLHQVTLIHGYYIGKYEVTQAQWQAVMGSNPSHFSACGGGCPVEQVSWDDICGGTTGSDCTSSSFIGKLNAYLGTAKLRLPTEAEWEYAARAGTQTEFSFSAPSSWDTGCGSFPEGDAHMWWCGNSGNQTHGVGSKQPNGFGLYDVHGNVWEWVADWYQEKLGTSPVTDPAGPSSGASRVMRGGAWLYTALACRSAFRSNVGPDFRNANVGFRLASSE